MAGLGTLERRLHGELDERNHAIEGCWQTDVTDERLEILQVVLEREPPPHDQGMRESVRVRVRHMALSALRPEPDKCQAARAKRAR